jgi:hypothetical protein
MNEQTSASDDITTIEPAATEQWLSEALAAARARIKDAPSSEAVARVRARVLTEAAPPRRTRIAA